MLTIKLSSMTNASKAFSALRNNGIGSRIEKGTSGGCAYRLLVNDEQSRSALQVLRNTGVSFDIK